MIKIKKKSFKVIYSVTIGLSIIVNSVLAGQNAKTKGETSFMDSPVKYSGALYLWAAAIEGTAAGGQEIDMRFKDILENLDLTFMGAFEVQKAKWLLHLDAIYLKLSVDEAGSIPLPIAGLNINGNADVDMDGTIINGLIGREVYSNNMLNAYLFGGIRYLNLTSDSDLELRLDAIGRTRAIKVSVSGDTFDAIAGIKGEAKINDKWSVPYIADIGAGDSDITWQLRAGIRYSLDWGSINLLYRHMKWDFKSDAKLRDINFSGPLLGAIYNF